MLRYEISKFIGSYYVALGGCDAIVFTAGLGENQPHHREAICESLACLGVEIDKDKNNAAVKGHEGLISKPDSKSRYTSSRRTKSWSLPGIQSR